MALGEDSRAGRWWWENEDAKECGLHLSPHSAAASAAESARSAVSSGIVSAQAHVGAADVKGAHAPGRSQNAKECGLHLSPHSAAASAAESAHSAVLSGMAHGQEISA